MKRLFTFFIAVLYLGVSSGVALQVHYCMDEVAAFTVMPKPSDKCDTCGMKGNSCCRDEVTFLKLQDDHKQQAFNFEAQKFVASLPEVLILSDHSSCKTRAVTAFTDSSPPPLSPQKKHILHCRYNV